MLKRGCGACKAPHRVVGKVMNMEYVSAGARKAGEVSQGTNLLESLPNMDRDITTPSKTCLIIGHSKFRLKFCCLSPARASFSKSVARKTGCKLLETNLSVTA